MNYSDFKDKSIEGIKNTVIEGLGLLSFKATTEKGIPFDLFKEQLNDRFPTDFDKILFYLQITNEKTRFEHKSR